MGAELQIKNVNAIFFFLQSLISQPVSFLGLFCDLFHVEQLGRVKLRTEPHGRYQNQIEVGARTE